MSHNARVSRYDLLTDSELETALEKLKIDKETVKREGMIKLLQEAHKDIRFQFLDLPAELRNLVYEELFTWEQSSWHSESKHCYPQILATCKAINKEASAYLNDIDQVEIRMLTGTRRMYSPSGTWYDRSGLHIWFNGAAVFPSKRITTFDLVRWPKLLRRVRTVVLTIELRLYDIGDQKFHGSAMERRLNSSLYSLYGQLYQSKTITSLRVRGRGSCTNDYEEHVLNAISPLSALAGVFREDDLHLDLCDLSFSTTTKLGPLQNHFESSTP